MSAGRTLSKRVLSLWPYLLVAFLYLATSPYHRGLNNPNEMVRLYMTAAWVDDGTFAIKPVIRRWGMVDDKAVRDGVLYSSKAPLQSLLGIPGYAASKPVLEALGVAVQKRTQLFVVRLFGAVVFGIAFSWLLIFWARKRVRELGAPAGLGTALGITAGLGTMLYPYSLTFTGHQLAAFGAGGCYLALIGLTRADPGTARWRWMAALAGFAGGATPFAESPAALVAGPALVAAVLLMDSWKRRGALIGWLAAGGALPFGLGLWVHHVLWGSPLRTGYSFLENKGYVEVHGEGFFGVSFPKADALGGSLFSPGTGLFFFSPILLVGLAMVLLRVFGRTRGMDVAAAPAAGDPIPMDIAADLATDEPPPNEIPRALAVAALFGFLFSLYFISSHRGWRGGWTVGPRYIIAVAPLLWIWVVEACARPKIRPWVAAFGALSVVMTGFAAALYPHLSDVYTNPLATFLVPSYVAGEMSYGLGHLVGLTGHAANAVHLVPLFGALIYIALAGTREADDDDPPKGRWTHRLIVVFGAAAAMFTLVALIPEQDEAAARRENRRLWGFWEPSAGGEGPGGARRHKRPGRVYSARGRYNQITVTQLKDGAPPRPCKRSTPGRCRYGDDGWQQFGPDVLDMDGVRERILFMHPIAGATVRATIPAHPKGKVGVLRFGLADQSVTSDNDRPVKVTLRQAGEVLVDTEADNTFGLRAEEFTVTSTLPFELDIQVERDGARVFGWDLELYKE